MTWITTVWHAVDNSSEWMAWNLFLAVLPFALSVWLFRAATHRSILWWTGVLVFIAFLPNAPYVLTDLIHLVKEIQGNSSLLVSTLVIIPKYLVFVLLGFEAYVLALLNLNHYLRRQGLGSYLLQIECILHGLSAIGVYLGRFERLNSWNLVTHPHQVFRSLAENLLDQRPLMLMLVGFVLIAGLYWVLKQITLAMLLQRRYSRLNRRSQA